MAIKKQNSPYPHWLYNHPEIGDSLRIVPERGGLVSGWSCDGKEMLYFDQDRFSNCEESVRGGIPVLFPICGSLLDDLFPLPSGNYLLKQHGFARDRPWELKELEDHSGIVLSLSDSEETKCMFPFPFLVEISFQLAYKALEISVNITNKGHLPMPYSFGLHPYFLINNLKGVSFKGMPENCFDHIAMTDTKTSHHLSRISQGVDFLIRPEDGFVTLIDEGLERSLKLVHTPPMDLIVIWTDPPRPMVCFEPWTSPRNSLITGDRKLVLEPGGIQHLSCKYISS